MKAAGFLICSAKTKIVLTFASSMMASKNMQATSILKALQREWCGARAEVGERSSQMFSSSHGDQRNFAFG
jgi:hypothetical protein